MAFLKQQYHLWLLGFWIWIGSLLRFTNLGLKPPWTDEFATILYGRGDDYSRIPIGEILSAEMLIEPLKGYPSHGVFEVAKLLIQRNNHPPLFFMLVNVWQRFFPLDSEGYIAMNGVRSLAVLFGIGSIIAIYWVAKLAFSSEVIAQISAALMSFSPFVVYLAQEARHYTLIILVAIASLGFCVVALRRIKAQQTFSKGFIIGWFALSCCGLLIHYFFVITLAAEAIALIWCIKKNNYNLRINQQLSLLFILIGVGIFGIIWKWQFLPPSYGKTMTDWTYLDYSNWLDLVLPFWQFIAIFGSMLIALPTEVNSLPIIVFSCLTTALIDLRLVTFWWRGMQHQAQEQNYQPSIFFLNRFILVSWIIFAVVIFGFGVDISRASRYSFVYFPVIILSLAASLSYFWQQDNWQRNKITFLNLQTIFQLPIFQSIGLSKSGSQAIALILVLSLSSGFSVVQNLAFAKPYDPGSVLDNIKKNAQSTILLTPYNSTVQIGEMMGIAWEKYRRSPLMPLYFAFIPEQEFIRDYSLPIETLLKQAKFPSIQLWAINFFEPLELDHCDFLERKSIKGYYSDLYNCALPLTLNESNLSKLSNNSQQTI
jgi:uncharacterized membrane protein